MYMPSVMRALMGERNDFRTRISRIARISGICSVFFLKFAWRIREKSVTLQSDF